MKISSLYFYLSNKFHFFSLSQRSFWSCLQKKNFSLLSICFVYSTHISFHFFPSFCSFLHFFLSSSFSTLHKQQRNVMKHKIGTNRGSIFQSLKQINNTYHYYYYISKKRNSGEISWQWQIGKFMYNMCIFFTKVNC